MAEIELLFISSRMQQAAEPVQDLGSRAEQHVKVITQ